MPTPIQHAIEQRLRAGVPLAEVERDLIAPAPLDEERRSALWLYAWLRSEQVPGRRRAVVPVRIAS